MGSIARLGSGELTFAAMPVGFYLGCTTADRLFMPPAPHALEAASPAFGAPGWLMGLFALLAVARIASSLRAPDRSLRPHWSPHAATAVFGLAFRGVLLVVGAWGYTELLADLARAMGDAAMAQNLSARVMIGIALFAGALIGGRLTGQLRRQPVAVMPLARSFGGGVLMGWGSLLTPGGNDALVLIGMPLLWPFAWAAFAILCMTVALARWSVSQVAAGCRRSAP
jgi:toxin CptA